MSHFHKPRVHKSGRTTQISYELPHRVFCTKVHPTKAPNGSTIVLYGHTNGLKIIWRGGRPVKRSITTLDGEPTGPTRQDHLLDGKGASGALFEDEAEAFETSQGVPAVVQDLEVTLDTEVLSIALAPVPSQRWNGMPIPTIFENYIVFAVACGDSSVKVLMVALDPPVPETKQKLGRLLPEQYAVIAQIPAGPRTHRSPPLNLSLTWTARDALHTTESQPPQDDEWDLLLASAGPDLSGILLLTRIPLASGDGSQQPKNVVHAPFQRVNLLSQAISIAFNPLPYPARRHAQLLVAERKGRVHVYEPLGSTSSQPYSDSDGDSTAGISSSGKGTWAATFTTPYQPQSASATEFFSPGLAYRQSLLGAQWACQGQSIVILTADGETGLWDVDSGDTNELRMRNVLPSGNPGKSSASASRTSRSGLAPMTPNTRAAKAQRLFSSTSPATPTNVAPQGGLDVIARDTKDANESVIFWYGSDIYSIANLQAFRKRSEGGGRSTNSLYGSGLSRVEGLDPHGETISSVAQLPFAEGSSDSHSHADVVVSTDSRVIVLAKQAASLRLDDSSALARRADDEEMEDDEQERADMELLGREELGLAGIEKLANSMSGSRLFGKSGGRKVLFAAS